MRSLLLVNVYRILIILLLGCPQPSFATRLFCGAYSDLVAGRQSQSIVDTKGIESNLPLIEKLRSLPGGEKEYQLIQQRRLEWNKAIQTKFGKTSIEKLIPVGLKKNVQPTNYNSTAPRTVMISEAEFNVLNKQFLEYKPILDKMSELLQDADRLYVLLQRFWLETLIEKSVSNVNTKTAFENILQRYERKAGFPDAINLEPKSYSTLDWWAMLKEGRPFNDLGFTKGEGDRYYHYSLTHRLQWTLVFMQMEANPGYFGLPRDKINNVLSPLLSFMGDERLRNRLEWKLPPRADELWNTFDTFESNGTSPEWLSETFMHGVAGEWY